MQGLRVYINQQDGSRGDGVFYSRRDDGPYYCWHYEEELDRWTCSRVRPDDCTRSLLSLMTWKAVPVSLQAELYEHYLE